MATEQTDPGLAVLRDFTVMLGKEGFLCTFGNADGLDSDHLVVSGERLWHFSFFSVLLIAFVS